MRGSEFAPIASVLIPRILGRASDPDRPIERPGAISCNRVTSVMFFSASVAPVTAVIASGTSCRFSETRWAVTTMSPTASAFSSGVAVCAIAGAAISAAANAITETGRLRRFTRCVRQFMLVPLTMQTWLYLCRLLHQKKAFAIAVKKMPLNAVSAPPISAPCVRIRMNAEVKEQMLAFAFDTIQIAKKG